MAIQNISVPYIILPFRILYYFRSVKYTPPGTRDAKMADIKLTLEQQERVLTENCDFIIKHLDADDVIDELIQARLMGKNAAIRVQLVTMTRVDKNRIIFEQLSIAGPGALEKFCDILKKEKRQTFIAEQLEKCSRKC